VPQLDAAAFSRLFFARDGIARAWSQFMVDYRLILTPTWTQLTFEEGFDVASEDNAAAEMIRPVVPRGPCDRERSEWLRKTRASHWRSAQERYRRRRCGPARANLIGLPSGCVPAGQDPATGLPIGILITGRRMHDMECLDAAEAIEASFRLPTPIDPR
jgi:amidase